VPPFSPVGAAIGATAALPLAGYALPLAKADGVVLTVPDGVTAPGEPLRVTPRIAVRKPALALDAFLEAIDPGNPQAPCLAAVRVIAPKPAAHRPAAAQVKWWYGQAKAVAAALLVATASRRSSVQRGAGADQKMNDGGYNVSN
jgi:hypothetical protein